MAEVKKAVAKKAPAAKAPAKVKLNNATYATGKRKDSVARVYLIPGKGNIIVNDLPMGEYFKRAVLQMIIAQPFGVAKRDGAYDVVAMVMGGEPDIMFQKAIAAFGGMKNYVKSGQKVVIKPNIGWNRKPEIAANTNPILVAEMVKQCLAAGAKEVVVFDHTCDGWADSYKNSGIEDAVKEAGGVMVPGKKFLRT